MDWLRRNGKTEEQNQLLVANNPLIPYALIISLGDLKYLEKNNHKTLTISPVPILVREQLENPLMEGYLIEAGHAHFYVYYDGKLLNQSYFEEVLEEKRNLVDNQRVLLDNQLAALNLLQEKEGILRFQRFTNTVYSNAIAEVNTLNQEIADNNDAKRSLNIALEQNKMRLETTKNKLTKLNEDRINLQQHVKALTAFINKYETYLKIKVEVLQLKRQINEKKLEKIDAEKALTQLRERLDALGLQERDLNWSIAKQDNELNDFLIYQSGEMVEKDIDDLKAEYRAIISKFSGNLQELQADYVRVNELYQSEENYYVSYMKHHHLIDTDIEGLIYSEAKMGALLKETKYKEEEVSKKRVILDACRREVIALSENLKFLKKELLEKFQTSDIMPKFTIVQRNFKEEINGVKRQMEAIQSQIQKLQVRKAMLEENKGSLIMFGLENPMESVVVTDELRTLDKSGWLVRRGNLLRDYNELQQRVTKEEREIGKIANAVMKDELLQDDFFKQPLTSLNQLQGTPKNFLEQYQIITDSFSTILEKLEIDISLNEKERMGLLNLFLDYILDVHNNLAQIDKNSRISIRGRQLQMLRIKLSDWEKSVDIYYERLSDYLLGLTNRCLELIEKNETIENTIDSHIKTILLYDTVVGSSTVQIKLYKVEAEREYPINWDNVAKNSGGEGFLSAFVILSSLLSYMRRDESDVFATDNEGKVLLMDNPFAQTNAAHLLKPLMELAKINNTQLICLSGLGGESIYSRFENIYSLSLRPSTLHKGNELLKSDHIKGEFEMITPTRIRVEEEQLSLF